MIAAPAEAPAAGKAHDDDGDVARDRAAVEPRLAAPLPPPTPPDTDIHTCTDVHLHIQVHIH